MLILEDVIWAISRNFCHVLIHTCMYLVVKVLRAKEQCYGTYDTKANALI